MFELTLTDSRLEQLTAYKQPREYSFLYLQCFQPTCFSVFSFICATIILYLLNTTFLITLFFWSPSPIAASSTKIGSHMESWPSRSRCFILAYRVSSLPTTFPTSHCKAQTQWFISSIFHGNSFSQPLILTFSDDLIPSNPIGGRLDFPFNTVSQRSPAFEHVCLEWHPLCLRRKHTS